MTPLPSPQFESWQQSIRALAIGAYKSSWAVAGKRAAAIGKVWRGARLRYYADITAGSLKVAETRIIAALLLDGRDEQGWHKAINMENRLQTHSPATATRLARLLKARLETMDSQLWRIIRDANLVVATHACLAAAVKHSALLGDFLDTVVREQYRLYSPTLPLGLWERYIGECRSRDPEMPVWSDSTVRRLRSSVYQSLSQAGYIDSTRSLRLQTVHIARETLDYLGERHEKYVLRCIGVSQ